MIKKLITILLAFAMVFAMSSCGKNNDDEEALLNGGIEGFYREQEITIPVKEYGANGQIVEYEQTGKYTGEFVAGEPTGDAIFEATNPDGVSYTYSGYFANNTFNGFGKLQYENSTRRYLKGTFTDGLYTPTLAECLENIGGNNLAIYGGFAMTSDTRSFLNSRSELFPCENPNLLSDAVSTDVTVEGIKKDFESNDGKLIKLTKLTVSEVVNKFAYGYDASTTIAKDAMGNTFAIHASFESGYEEGDVISTAYVLPIANVFYNNGTKEVETIVALAAYLF